MLPYTAFNSQLYNACAHSCSNFIKEAGLIISEKQIYLQGRLTTWLPSDLSDTWSDWQQHLALTQFLSLDSSSNGTGTLTRFPVEWGKSWKLSSPLPVNTAPYTPVMCPETLSIPKLEVGSMVRVLCSDSKGQGVIVPRASGEAAHRARVLRATPQHWAENQSSSSPQKVTVWGFMLHCGDRDVSRKGAAIPAGDGHWGRCWSRAFRNPSGAGHFDPLPRAVMTVTGDPQGFPNPPLLLAMPDPAPPPELALGPQSTPGL